MSSRTSRRWLTLVSIVLLVALLLGACRAAAPAPTPTPLPPTATPVPPTATPVPPTATPGPLVEPATHEVTSGHVDHDGVRIYYETAGEGPPLVLVHWATGSIEDWKMFGYVDALADDYRLIMVDMRGHGQSDKPRDPAAYDAKTQAGDIVAVLDELGIDQAHYFGYSLGGRLGWAVATHAPERVASLIVGGNAPAAWDDREWAAWLRDMGPSGLASLVDEIAQGNGVWRPGVAAAYEEADLEAVILSSAALNADGYEGALPGLPMPVLLLAGTLDEDYPGMEWAGGQLPNATLASMPDLDHFQGFVLMDQALPHITAFLAEVSAEPAEAAARLDDETVAAIEAILEQQMRRYQVPGMTICIVQDGSLMYSKAFGVAQVDSEQPVTPQSIFLMASASKSLTAVAIMQLVEQGEIDLDASVTVYLPQFTMADERYQAITVRQLLSHRSGLGEEFGHEYRETTDPMRMAVTELADQELENVPGEEYLYTGVGYAVLGDIIATVSGMSYEDYLQTHILRPLGMTSSTFVPELVDQQLLAKPHVTTDDRSVVVSDAVECDGRSTAGCTLFSSCEDMVRFARFSLNQGELEGVRLLDAGSFDQMWTSHGDTGANVPVEAYGLGWQLGEIAGHRIAGHAGGVAGYNAHLLMAPDDGVAVITMSNWADGGGWPASFTTIQVMYALLGV